MIYWGGNKRKAKKSKYESSKRLDYCKHMVEPDTDISRCHRNVFIVKQVPNHAIAIVAWFSTLSAILAFIYGLDRRQLQLQSFYEFSKLMMRMVHRETEREYERIWEDYNKGYLVNDKNSI